jgi:hypothetical protein
LVNATENFGKSGGNVEKVAKTLNKLPILRNNFSGLTKLEKRENVLAYEVKSHSEFFG